MAPSTRSALTPFLILFAALYAGFGVQSPYLPALLDDRGLRPEAIGMLLSAGTASDPRLKITVPLACH